MKVKATVLIDNYAFGSHGVFAQHGWAVFLETDQGNYLLDTGAGKIIVNNAQALGVDLDSILGIILSHHHHDHTGGLLEVLEHLRRPIPVYAHPGLFKDSFMRKDGEFRHSGIPFRREVLETKGACFDLDAAFREIAPGLWLTGAVPRTTSYELGEPRQVIRQEEGFIQDPLEEDLSVVIRTEGGLFVVLGCAHAGIVNTLRYAMERTGETRIHTVCGGTHLGLLGETQREESIRDLKALSIGCLGVSHCTGMQAALRMAQEFGERFVFCKVGAVFAG
ncbi:MAG: MBL fold metallo-hydrolase [Deltaproteobacteria bacterium]|nr:MBL fold metallo-hydrolase [Deltaproteobacteria bacterium]